MVLDNNDASRDREVSRLWCCQVYWLWADCKHDTKQLKTGWYVHRLAALPRLTYTPTQSAALAPPQIAEHVLGQHRYRAPGDDGKNAGDDRYIEK